jgi:hypothetical protein
VATKLIQRFARWVLEDELNGIAWREYVATRRAELAEQAAERVTVAAYGQVKTAEAKADRAQAAHAALVNRIWRGRNWWAKYSKGAADVPLAAHCVLQWIDEGDEGARANTRGVSAFDRWQIFPKP